MEYSYYEVQYFSWWVYLLIAIVIAIIVWMILLGRLSRHKGLGVGIFVLVVVLMTLRMTTFITEQSLTVSFGWIPILRTSFSLSGIDNAQVCAYRPLSKFWGWGWRYSLDGTQALTAQGTQGVCFHLQDGRTIVVGSAKSGELLEAVQAHRTKS